MSSTKQEKHIKIFLTYGSEQIAAAETLALALANRGHEVFFDRTSLPPGTDFNKLIQFEIASNDLMVFLISPDSVR
jgi:hypothetical protein